MKPSFSILIPTLNEEKWIEKTLKSIKNQTIKNYEIIIVDGHSKDKTIEIARKYTNKIFISKSKGPGNARNFGANNSKADIIVFLDADTIILPKFLEILNKEFLNKRLICCSPIPKYDGNISQLILLKVLEIIFRFSIIFGRPILPGICLAVRKKEFNEVNGFNENLASTEDLDLTYRLSKKGDVKMISTFFITSSRREKMFGWHRITFLYSLATIKFLLFRYGEIKKYPYGIFKKD